MKGYYRFMSSGGWYYPPTCKKNLLEKWQMQSIGFFTSVDKILLDNSALGACHVTGVTKRCTHPHTPTPTPRPACIPTPTHHPCHPFPPDQPDPSRPARLCPPLPISAQTCPHPSTPTNTHQHPALALHAYPRPPTTHVTHPARTV